MSSSRSSRRGVDTAPSAAAALAVQGSSSSSSKESKENVSHNVMKSSKSAAGASASIVSKPTTSHNNSSSLQPHSNKANPLFASGYLDPQSKNKKELVDRLEKLFEHLKDLGQDAELLPLECRVNVIPHLVDKNLVKHADKDVRLLVACCLVEVLRICVPENPYNESEMFVAFELFVSLFRNLATVDAKSTAGARLLWVLYSLASVKSCALIAFVAENESRANAVMNSLFEVLLNSVRGDHSADGKTYIPLCQLIFRRFTVVCFFCSIPAFLGRSRNLCERAAA
jgi:hypothetical protein